MTRAPQQADLLAAEAAEWLARQDGAAPDAAAQVAFERWLATSTAHRIAYLRVRAAWRAADALPLLERPDWTADAAPTPAASSARGRPRLAQWRLAAGLLLACGLGMLLWLPDGQRDAGTRYATALGEHRQLALADGSQLTLNTDTRLRATARHVWLDRGEAYFDIAHDAAHPFVVEAGASRITVLGTRFSVRRDGDAARVVVTQGRVLVHAGKASVQLTPDQAASASASRIERASLTPQGTAQQLAWREGRLVLDRMTLAQAAAEFNRYNQRKLVISDPAAARIVLGGSFSPTNLDGFVRLLERGFGLRARRDGEQIDISY